MSPKFFPTCLMLMDIEAAIVWTWNGDFRKAIYWGAAAVLTASITY